MTKAMLAAATVAALLLSACGRSATNEATANASANQANVAAESTNAVAGKEPAANQANAAPAAPTGGPSATASSPSSEIRRLLVGRWAEGGDCARATELRDDGTFTSPAGQGRWTLESEYLTLAGAGPNADLAVQEINASEMATVNPMGHIGHWTRC